MLFCKKSQKRCSFLLTSEEKEPKKTATPKPLHRGFSLFRGKTLSIKVLVWLAKPVPYRASHILLNGALPHIYLIPENTENLPGGQILADLLKTKTPSASLWRMNSAESMCLTILSRNTLKFHQVFYWKDFAQCLEREVLIVHNHIVLALFLG